MTEFQRAFQLADKKRQKVLYIVPSRSYFPHMREVWAEQGLPGTLVDNKLWELDSGGTVTLVSDVAPSGWPRFYSERIYDPSVWAARAARGA